MAARHTCSAAPGRREGTPIVHELLDLAAKATPYNARQLRVCLEEWLRLTGVPTAVAHDLGLAAYEALANVAEHAYLPHHPNPDMRLQARLDREQVMITVSDQGGWRPPGKPGYRGRGLVMMRDLATEVHLHPTDHGTTVSLHASLPPGGP